MKRLFAKLIVVIAAAAFSGFVLTWAIKDPRSAATVGGVLLGSSLVGWAVLEVFEL